MNAFLLEAVSTFHCREAKIFKRGNDTNSSPLLKTVVSRRGQRHQVESLLG